MEKERGRIFLDFIVASFMAANQREEHFGLHTEMQRKFTLTITLLYMICLICSLAVPPVASPQNIEATRKRKKKGTAAETESTSLPPTPPAPKMAIHNRKLSSMLISFIFFQHYALPIIWLMYIIIIIYTVYYT